MKFRKVFDGIFEGGFGRGSGWIWGGFWEGFEWICNDFGRILKEIWEGFRLNFRSFSD